MLKKMILIWLLGFSSLYGHSQIFNVLPPQKINTPNGSQFGTISWGDYDNDNDLDILVTGKDGFRTYIFRNLGNDSFAVLNYNLPQLAQGSNAQFADFDNDGDLDIFLSGNNQSPYITAVYKNTLPDSIGFVKVINNPNSLLGTDNVWIDIFDIDNDGDLDLFHYGFVPSLGYKEFYHINQGNNNFSSQFAPYNDIYIFVKFLDFNKDGFNDAHRWNNHIYTNSADFNFQFNDSDSIKPCGRWNYVDFNLDGRIDIQGYGIPDSLDSNYIKIYQNYPNDSFGLIFPSTTGILKKYHLGLRSCVFDANNDGKYDIMAADDTNIYFFKNKINFFDFSIDSTFSFIIYDQPDLLSFADYDNDGDLDVFASGWYNTWPYNFATIFRNDSTPPNTPPTAPNLMWTEMDSTKIIFRWLPATDVETPQATLSYNLMVGTTPKGIDITSPMADTVTGFRRVVELGNAQLNNFYILDKSNFALGDTLYWSVQTIDNGFGYSPFSKGNSAIVHQNMTLENRTLCSNMDSISWKGQYFDSAGIYFHGNGVVSNFDSAFFLQLDTAPAYLQSQTIDLCAGSSYNWNGQNLMSSGIYNKYYTTTQGCDSIERLVLTIQPNYTNVQTADLCLGDSVALGNQWLGSAGVYFDTLQTTFGCDSLVWLTIAVAPDDSTVIQTADSLVAQSSTAQILWWDCDKQQFIYGVGGQVFVPQYNGHFAAELTQNGCTYRTRCFEVINVGILSLSKGSPQINIRPNPSSGKVFINASETILSITLIDSYGKIITEIEELKTKEIELDISQFAPGIYTLKVETEVGVEMRKLVKE
jgi:hypothetical protein